LWWASAGGGAGHRGRRGKARSGRVARGHREHHGGQRASGRSGRSRAGSRTAVSGGDGRIQSTASRRGACFRRPRGSAALPDSQAAECARVPAGELPERLRPTDAECLRHEQLHGSQDGLGENLPAARKNQSHGGQKPRGRTGRDANGTSLRYRSGVAAKTRDHQPDRIVFIDGAACGTKRKALATRKPTAALDRNRTPGGGEKVPTHQGLSRTFVAEGASESVAPSAEGGQNHRSRLNSVVRSPKVAQHQESLQSTKTRTSSLVPHTL